jgi:ribonuclease-3 family protein
LVGFTRINSLEIEQLQKLSPTALAYLGDAVYELYVRSLFLIPPQRISSYHQKVVSQVRAEAQAHHLDLLLPRLTPEELDIVRRGRNANKKSPGRLAAATYQQATALETLLGYLYLKDSQRLLEIFSYCQWGAD